MTQRIRYVKTSKDNILKSYRNLRSDSTNASYTIELDIASCIYTIKNVTSGRKYDGGEGVNNLHVLKRNVKSRLSSLGVNFGKEIRDNSTRVVGENCGYKKEAK